MKYLLTLLIASMTSAHAGPMDRPKLTVPFADVEPSLKPAPGDPMWARAATVGDLELPLGATGPQTHARTKVSLLWTKNFLWVLFRCDASTVTRLPGAATTSPERDLPYYRADCVEMFLDPVGDGKAYVEIQVSPDNGVFDGLHLYTANVQSEENFLVKEDLIRRESWFFLEWNLAGLQTATNIHLDAEPKGWSAVLALPANPLLHRSGQKEFAAGLTLRANFLRFDYSTQPGPAPVITNWAPVPAGRAHRAPAGMGYLTLSEAAAHSPD